MTALRRPRRYRRRSQLAAFGAAAVLLAMIPTPTGAVAGTPLPAPPPEPAVELPATGWPVPPAATAQAYVLLDATSGQVLAARQPELARPVASTVKVLTALSVLSRAEMDDEVLITAESANAGGASIGLREGERWLVGDLLAGLIVRSGNDAAIALAVHVAGSVDGFVALMRQDAARLGLDDVVLVTPSGLDDQNRLSASDLATLARAAMTDPRFRRLAAAQTFLAPNGQELPSRNELLDDYPGATGIKTGFTDAAGYSLIASARRGGDELIAVVLDSADANARFTDAARLLDHGFGQFDDHLLVTNVKLARAGEDRTIDYPPTRVQLPRGSTAVLAVELPIATDVTAPSAEIVWQGRDVGLVEAASAPPGPAGERGSGSAAVGAWLVDRAYEAMRAATRTDRWER